MDQVLTGVGVICDPALTRHEDAWVEATLTDPVRPADPMARLTDRFPHTLSLVFDPDRAPDDPDVSYARRLAGRTDREVRDVRYAEAVTIEIGLPDADVDTFCAWLADPTAGTATLELGGEAYGDA